MTTFVLIPGAGGAGEVYWREVAAGLTRLGHVAVPVEIAGDDPALGLPEYAALTDAAIGEHRDVVLVAQSMGGFTAPMVAKRDQLAGIVLLNAMVPLPGETPGQWWEAVGHGPAFEAAAAAAGRPASWDVDELFLHDVPADARADMADGEREPADTPFGQPCTFDVWPDVPVHVLVGADDRLFPVDLQVRVARERLGVEADVVPGGHLVARSRPDVVVDRLLASAAGLPFTLAAAAGSLRAVATGVRDDQLDDPTPCGDWTVRELAAHVTMLVPAFARTARHESGAAPPPPGPLAGDWREQLDRDLDDLVAAWLEPSAWVGESEAGGFRTAAADLAVVALDELVLHGWDLARATGQPFTADDRDVELCTGFAAAMSTPEAQGSRGGLFGPVVDAGASPTPLANLLALAGRTPGVSAGREAVPGAAWTPGAPVR